MALIFALAMLSLASPVTGAAEDGAGRACGSAASGRIAGASCIGSGDRTGASGSRAVGRRSLPRHPSDVDKLPAAKRK